MKPRSLSEEGRNRLRLVRLRTSQPDLSRFPDFLIVGPQRTGTTWLYHNLKQHPEVFLPHRKETYYFSTLGKAGHARFEFEFLEDYLALFSDRPRQRLKKHYDCLRKSFRLFRPRCFGEATATYAGLGEAVIAEIVLLNPEMKAILMLRDPVERAWSHGKKDFMRHHTQSPACPFEEWRAFFEGKGQRRMADYGTMIAAWERHLKPGHLFLGDYRLIAERPGELLAEIAGFLGIQPDALRSNPHLHTRINPTSGESMPAELVRFLEDLLVSERAEFQKHLPRCRPAFSA